MTSVPPLPEQVEAALSGPRPLPVLQAGDPRLRLVAQRWDRQIGLQPLRELVQAMRQTMEAAPGVGLAAPQVGVGLALVVLADPAPVDPHVADVRDRRRVPFRVLLNPDCTPVGRETVSFYEGCLSVRGYRAVTPRYRRVRLTGVGLDGRPVDEVLSGWAARIVQHEVDHLRGTLYVDHAEARSVTSEANHLLWWAREARPEQAARVMGFDLEGEPR